MVKFIIILYKNLDQFLFTWFCFFLNRFQLNYFINVKALDTISWFLEVLNFKDKVPDSIEIGFVVLLTL